MQSEELGIWEYGTVKVNQLSAHCSAAPKNTSQQGLPLPYIKTSIFEEWLPNPWKTLYVAVLTKGDR